MRGKPLDPEKNPLHRGLAQELARHGLDFSMLCEMANKKFTWKGGKYGRVEDDEDHHRFSVRHLSSGEVRRIVSVDGAETDGDEEEEGKENGKEEDNGGTSCPTEGKDFKQIAVDRVEGMKSNRPSFLVDEWFALFWKTYPNTCPRKVDKKKCRDKFLRIISDAKGRGDRKFEEIMAGLGWWLQSEMWNGDGGRFIKAPLVWLNGSCWEDSPMKGNGNGDISRQGTRRCDNSFSSGASDIARLF